MINLALQSQEQQTELKSLSQDLLKSWDTDSLANALERVVRIVESGVPPAALAMALQIWYRTLSGNTFTESLQSVTERAHFSRNYALKGLKLLQELNLISCTKRPGQTDEYSFMPIEEWQQYIPPIPDKNDRTNKIVEFPTQQEEISVQSEPTEPIPDEDVPVEDTNVVVSSIEIENSNKTTTTVEVPDGDTPWQPWQYVGQGVGRVYKAELDADTADMVEKIKAVTLRPRPLVIKDAVKLLYEKTFVPANPTVLTAVGDILTGSTKLTTQQIPTEVINKLKQNGIHLTLIKAERLWQKYSDRFDDAIAYTLKSSDEGKIKTSVEGYFVRCLEQNWETKRKPQKPDPLALTREQQEWLNDAVVLGFCYGQIQEKSAQPAVSVIIKQRNPFDPPTELIPVKQAMVMGLVFASLTGEEQDVKAIRQKLDFKYSVDQINEALGHLDRIGKVQANRSASGDDWMWRLG